MTDPIEMLRKLAEAATPGPWGSCHGGHSSQNGKLGNWVETRNYDLLPEFDSISRIICDCPNDGAHPDDNARLVAAMRNALPALLDLVEAADKVHALNCRLGDGHPAREGYETKRAALAKALEVTDG